MKHLTAIAVVFLAAISLALPSMTLAQDSQQSATTNSNPSPAELARGAQAWSRECGRCHNIRSPSELSDEEWEVSVTHMRVRANIPADEARAIISFLQASNN